MLKFDIVGVVELPATNCGVISAAAAAAASGSAAASASVTLVIHLVRNT